MVGGWVGGWGLALRGWVMGQLLASGVSCVFLVQCCMKLIEIEKRVRSLCTASCAVMHHATVYGLVSSKAPPCPVPVEMSTRFVGPWVPRAATVAPRCSLSGDHRAAR